MRSAGPAARVESDTADEGIGDVRSVAAVGPVVLLGLAAVIPPVRPFLALGLVLAYAASGHRGTRSAVLAATLPLAAILAWGALGQPPAAAGAADCANPVAPPAVWRFIEAAIGIAVVAILLVERRVSPGDLGLRTGSPAFAALALLGAAVVGPIAIVVATWFGSSLLGGSFFGTFALDLSQPAAIVPALLFAISNATAEELAYRGALLRWLSPSLGLVGANLAQAILFGLAHTGSDFVGSELPTVVAMILVGFIGGVVARRSGSLLLPIAIHAAADIPIYFFWACRIA